MAGMRVLVCSCVASVHDIYVYACELVCGTSVYLLAICPTGNFNKLLEQGELLSPLGVVEFTAGQDLYL